MSLKHPKGGKKQRAWVFTWCNYHKHADWEDIMDLIESSASYIIFGKEIAPTTKLLHLQGYVYFKNPRVLGGLQRFAKSISWRPAIASAADNRVYCSKDADYHEAGQIPEQGARTDLKEFVADLRDPALEVGDIIDRNPSNFLRYGRWGMALRDEYLLPSQVIQNRVVIFMTGEPGIGKTSWAWERFPNLYCLRPHPTSNAIWFNKYNSAKTLLLDEISGSWMKWEYLLHLLDIYPMEVPTKGGFTRHTANLIIMTSNQSLVGLYPGKQAHYPALERRVDCIVEWYRPLLGVTSMISKKCTKGKKIWNMLNGMKSSRTSLIPANETVANIIANEK